MLPTNQLMEALSRAYVRTIAARAGVICDDVLQDYGVDLFIREFAPVGKRYLDVGRQIDLQLKSTTRAALNDKSVLYDLDVPAYNLLRQLSPVPRLLILVVLPEDPLLYLEQSEEQLLLRGCAYWLSLRGAQATDNERTIRLPVPRTNLFSVAGIEQMLVRLRGGLSL